MAFLNLTHTAQENEKYGSIEENCQIFTIEQESVLAYFIKDFNGTPYGQQRQVPNPTVINTVKKSADDQIGKTVIFTSFFRQSQWYKDFDKDRMN